MAIAANATNLKIYRNLNEDMFFRNGGVEIWIAYPEYVAKYKRQRSVDRPANDARIGSLLKYFAAESVQFSTVCLKLKKVENCLSTVNRRWSGQAGTEIYEGSQSDAPDVSSLSLFYSGSFAG